MPLGSFVPQARSAESPSFLAKPNSRMEKMGGVSYLLLPMNAGQRREMQTVSELKSGGEREEEKEKRKRRRGRRRAGGGGGGGEG